MEENDDWQISFADMVVQLMCFFILIAAASIIDTEQYKVIAKSMENAMGANSALEEKKERDLQSIHQDLQAIINVEQNAAAFETRPNAVALGLKESVLFPSGKADLNQNAYATLSRIISSLTNIKYRITIEGHTDNIPIQSTQFPSNWELSSARACAVARLFINTGFPKDRVQVLGLADTKPLFPNTDEKGQSLPENQSKNRRVVILIHH